MKTTPHLDNLAVLILAAGKGTRMKSELPKVMHGYAGRPMLGHLLAGIKTLNPKQIAVVTGFGAEAVESYCNEAFPGCTFIRQTEQKGTGHAAQIAKSVLSHHEGPILILYGDVMLTTRLDVLNAIQTITQTNQSGLNLLAAEVDNPNNLGRLFYQNGQLLNIEEKDCTPEQRKIKTANPGIYTIHGPALWPLLDQLTPNNAQKELYLTDIIGLAGQAGLSVKMETVIAERPEMGINSRLELAAYDALYQNRRRVQAMNAGATLILPETIYFSYDTELEPDTTVGPFVTFGPGVHIASHTTILPFSHLEGTTIHSNARIGPFARLRPNTHIHEGAHIGNFVEIKNATIGSTSKANHLSYVGDADVGTNVNLGAGTITANYNRKTGKKSRTTIGNHASTGSGTVLVAPVTLADHSYTGANTVVRKDTEPFSLTAAAVENISKSNYSK
jgi:bifunctional UDP-N-acetylglucosamine pyrophosphorylase/glucosamine-1-phosphate N-acetyltransferase